MTGLVLAGGGAKGSYQIGAYLAFKKCRIKIDGIVGTSIGAFNAAMIVSGKEKELYDFWNNVNVGELLNFEDEYVDSINNEETFKELIHGIEQMSLIIKNKGIDNDNLKEILDNMIDEDKVRRSKMDFGLVTVRVKDLKPLYLFKEDMQEGKLSDYILASCNLPLFKTKKLIDDEYYVDGGLYDNTPINMLVDKGYKDIFVIEIQGIGFNKKVKKGSNIIRITPSRFLGSTLNVNQSKIKENIKLGYYDTLKVIKNYDGYKYIFKNYNDIVYNTLVKNVDEEIYTKCKKYFRTRNNKELVLKSLEYVMMKEKMTYFNVYNLFKLINNIRDNTNKNHFVYTFVYNLDIF